MIYRTLENKIFNLNSLSQRQKDSYRKVKKIFLKKDIEWTQFSNFWMDEAYKLRITTNSVLWKIFQDMEARIGVRQEMIWLPCQRWHEMLKSIIDKKFNGRVVDFCKATGISQSYMSHILAGRKSLSIKRLVEALISVGFQMVFIEADCFNVEEIK